MLAVHIQQAYNLPVVVKSSTTIPCSPFVLLFLLPNKDQAFESKTIQTNLNPFFNQMFEFPSLLPEDIRKKTLMMKVFHHGRSKNELIGTCVTKIPLTVYINVLMRDEKEVRSKQGRTSNKAE